MPPGLGTATQSPLSLQGRGIGAPVERKGGVVEERGEFALVGGLLRRVLVAEHVEGVAAEEKSVADLPDLDLGPGDRPAAGIYDPDRCVGLTVLLDASVRRREDVALGECARFPGG